MSDYTQMIEYRQELTEALQPRDAVRGSLASS